MKSCPTCGTVNDDEARFCLSCGSSLVPACPVCGEEVPTGARFCPNCGSELRPAEPAPVGQERRLVTVLFADITGSTSLGERLDPEELEAVMTTFFGAMREEIEAEGGTVEKFIGDAVMSAFGVPVAHEDDPARALRAALRLRERLGGVNEDIERRFGVSVQIRTGVNTGEVLATVNPRPGDPMVTGDAVNVAARLEQTAEPGEIVVSERTARAARGFRFRGLGERELRGKEEAIAAVRLEGAGPTGAERGVPGLHAPMIGRDRELELLRSVYRRSAEEGRPNLVTIYGEPGVGKSRLTREFVEAAERSQIAPVVLRGRCLPYGEGITYWPMAEILKGLADVRDSDPPDRTLARIVALGSDVLTSDVATEPRTAAAALAYTVGVEDSAVPFRAMEPREVRARIHAAWRSLFSGLASRAPVVVVIEDIHWADGALLDLLEELAERVVGPVLFLCPSRPEITNRRPDWGGGLRNVSTISLEPLSRDDADRLVGFLLEVEQLPEAVHARILERAEGNPFFVEEIIRHLIDEGMIVRHADHWRAAEHIGDVQIPDTVQGVLAARIDLLDMSERRILQRAAVVGRVFWPEPVGRLLNGERQQLRETLDRLEERELVRTRLTSSIAGEPEFIFKHILTRDVAYETLPKRERGRAHASVAEWIESMAGERRAEFAELLAYHYDEAYRSATDIDDVRGGQLLRTRALASSLEASEVARRRFALEAALRLVGRAVDLAVTPLERAASLEQRGLVARNDYQGDLSWESFRDAVEIRLRDIPEDGQAIASACAQAVENPMRWPGSMFHPPDEEEVHRHIDLGLERAKEGSEDRIRLLTAAAFTTFGFAPLRGTTPEEVEKCRQLGLQAAEAALEVGRPDLASAALDGAGSALVTIGDYGGLVSIVQRRLDLAESFDDPWEIGDVYDMAIWDWTMIGNYARARSYGDRVLEMAQLGAQGLAIHGLSWLAMADLQLGNWDRIANELGPLVERLLGPRAEDPPYFTQNMMGSLAVIELVRGGSGERRLELLRRMADARRSVLGVGGISAWLAWALLLHGSTSEAEAALEEGDRSGFRGHLPFLRQVQAEFLAETRHWDLVPTFLADARTYASDAGLLALPFHLDRLEGRHALAEGRETATMLLQRSRNGFASLSARWERARSDRLLAEALMEQGRVAEARGPVTDAAAVFEELGATGELERARSLADRLG